MECPDDGVFLFLSTPSARRATRASRRPKNALKNFYPRPPRGGRPPKMRKFLTMRLTFLSTPSARRATQFWDEIGERLPISIHALREEGDPVVTSRTTPFCRISIHALREEGDPTTPVTVRCMFLFLSTPSARRATACSAIASPLSLNFYPRPPRGGRPHPLWCEKG